MSNLLSDSGIFTFEISYLVDIVNKAFLVQYFMSIVSPHVITFDTFLRQHDLHLVDAMHVDTQGGALVGVAIKGPNNLKKTAGFNILFRRKFSYVLNLPNSPNYFERILVNCREFRDHMNTLAPKQIVLSVMVLLEVQPLD